MRVTRREFGWMGVAAAAASLPMVGQTQRRIGYCVIGLGEIAKHFIGGVRQSERSAITGLVSGDRAKAERMAGELGVAKDAIYSYAEMDRMQDNRAIDAVYVALPNAMHADFTVRSAKAGKHVLCEKPMAVSVAECEQMIAACAAAKVKLMIAYRMQYEPLTMEAIGLLRSGEIGEIRSIESAFGFDIQPGRWRTDKRMAGGGALSDVGIYCLNATKYLTGEEPAEFKAFGTRPAGDPRFRDVEESVSWTTRFPSGILASCSTTYGGEMPGFFRVTGSRGVLEMGPAFSYDEITMRVMAKGAAPVEKTNPEKDPTQFMREADAFAGNILDGTAVKASGEVGMGDMRSIGQIYRSAGLA